MAVLIQSASWAPDDELDLPMTADPVSAARAPGEADLLVGRLARGDRDAFEALYQRHARTTFAFLRSRLADRAAAEDVHQQVWLEVWERRAGYNPALASFLTWVMLIARSRAIDHQRRRQPEPLDPHLDLDSAAGASPSDTDEMLERWRLVDALARVPRDEAEMLRMRFRDGLTQREIAERTGVALGTVKTRMVAGLARLRDTLESEEQR